MIQINQTITHKIFFEITRRVLLKNSHTLLPLQIHLNSQDTVAVAKHIDHLLSEKGVVISDREVTKIGH